MKKIFVETDFAKLDVARKQRTGFPETVFCLGKSKEQVADILQNFASVGQNVLGTKCSPEQFDFALKKGLPVKYDSLSRVISLGQKETNPFRGNIAVCCAGTSDLPILEEAAQVAEFFGAVVERYVDIGVAGIQRLFAQIDNIQKADVVIELYSDYVCPLCYIHNIMLHKAVHDFSNIKIIHHNYPFDKECNPYISVNMHPNACFMARGAIAARNQGNYWEMSSLLYENQPTKMADMLKLAAQLGFDKDKFTADFNSEETSKEIENELQKAVNLEIDSTPTMYINGDKIVGVKPYYELKEILIEHGAKHK